MMEQRIESRFDARKWWSIGFWLLVASFVVFQPLWYLMEGNRTIRYGSNGGFLLLLLPVAILLVAVLSFVLPFQSKLSMAIAWTAGIYLTIGSLFFLANGAYGEWTFLSFIYWPVSFWWPLGCLFYLPPC